MCVCVWSLWGPQHSIEPKRIPGSFEHLPGLPPPTLHHPAARRIWGWDMERKLDGGDAGRRAAAVHPRGDRCGNIRLLNACHERCKSSQNFNWGKKQKTQPTTNQPQLNSLYSQGAAADLYTLGVHFISSGRRFSCMTPIVVNRSCTAKWWSIENVNSLIFQLTLIFIFELTQLIRRYFTKVCPQQSVIYATT